MQKVEKIIRELLQKLDIQGEVDLEERDDNFLVVKINSEEAGLLIGQGGQSLDSLQHLARIIASRDAQGGPIDFIVDVNDYRKNRLDLLRDMALSVARQVAQEKRTRMLEPMIAYERRAIHVALRGFEGIETESQGEGPKRRIVIRPTGTDRI